MDVGRIRGRSSPCSDRVFLDDAHSRFEFGRCAPAAIMLELAPVDVAPPAETPPEVTPGPQMTQAGRAETCGGSDDPAPAKPKKIVKEMPKPVVKPVREPPAPQTRAPVRAAAASKAASSQASNAAELSAWRSAWAAALSWNRHYPEAPRVRGKQDTVRLGLTIGRSGHVVSARIIGSSGSATLDQAALEMARSASGRPVPPEMGSSVSLIVPVRYSIR
jgi:protein TonB